MLDIDITLYKGLSGFDEDDIDMPTFPGNLMILGLQNFGLQDDVDNIDDCCNLQKQTKHIFSCNQYLSGFRNRHNLEHGSRKLGEAIRFNGLD